MFPHPLSAEVSHGGVRSPGEMLRDLRLSVAERGDGRTGTAMAEAGGAPSSRGGFPARSRPSCPQGLQRPEASPTHPKGLLVASGDILHALSVSLPQGRLPIPLLWSSQGFLVTWAGQGKPLHLST